MDGREEGDWRGEGQVPQLLWEEEEYMVYCEYGVDGAAAGCDGWGVSDWVLEAEGEWELIRGRGGVGDERGRREAEKMRR